MRLSIHLLGLLLAAACSNEEPRPPSGGNPAAIAASTASIPAASAASAAAARRACATDADCKLPQRCLASSTGKGRCADVCDPLAASTAASPGTCPTGRLCAGFFSVAGTVVAGCVKSGTKLENDPCMMTPATSDHDCAAGLYCLPEQGGTSAGRCARFCDAAHPCPLATQACTALADGAGTSTGYAICALPEPTGGQRARP